MKNVAMSWADSANVLSTEATLLKKYRKRKYNLDLKIRADSRMSSPKLEFEAKTL